MLPWFQGNNLKFFNMSELRLVSLRKNFKCFKHDLKFMEWYNNFTPG
jgi:hypothetical protein